MRILICTLAAILIFTACETPTTDDKKTEREQPSAQLQPTEGQQSSYNNLMQKLSESMDFASGERLRFLMIDEKKSLLHFFSIRKKDQQYTLGAEYEICIQVGNIRQGAYDKNCRDLFQDEYANFDQLLRSILSDPRHDQKEEGEPAFYFQHFSMTDSVIFGTGEDIFALELYLAFLRLTEADEALVRVYEERKNRLLSM